MTRPNCLPSPYLCRRFQGNKNFQSHISPRRNLPAVRPKECGSRSLAEGQPGFSDNPSGGRDWRQRPQPQPGSGTVSEEKCHRASTRRKHAEAVAHSTQSSAPRFPGKRELCGTWFWPCSAYVWSWAGPRCSQGHCFLIYQ